MNILAIETSCDETAAAVVATQTQNAKGKRQNCGIRYAHESIDRQRAQVEKPLEILSNVVASQIDIHKKYGGVFPELASRAHAESIIPVLQEALEKSKGKSQKEKVRCSPSANDLSKIRELMKESDAIAVTYGPGLIGSLLVGVAAAKSLAYAANKPIIPVNHWEGHIYSNFVRVNGQLTTNSQQLPKFPSLILTVSGGHTSLILMRGHGDYEILGQTRDDAAGEAFDKVAKLMGLPYPGGPVISTLADKVKSQKEKVKNKEGYKFPRPMVNEPGFDFSFSGLKTAVLYAIKDKELDENDKAAVASAFQEAVVETLIIRTKQAVEKYKPASLCLAGGVSANKLLRERFMEMAQDLSDKPTVHIPPMELTTDNAVMIGAAGYYRYLAHQGKKWYDVHADANAALV